MAWSLLRSYLLSVHLQLGVQLAVATLLAGLPTFVKYVYVSKYPMVVQLLCSSAGGTAAAAAHAATAVAAATAACNTFHQ